MAQGRGLVGGVAVAAAGAGVGGIAACGAGRLGDNSLVIVAQSLHRTGLKGVAAGAGAGLLTGFGAGGGCGYGPVAKVVAQGCRGVVLIAVSAEGAGVGGIAAFRTAGGGYGGVIGAVRSGLVSADRTRCRVGSVAVGGPAVVAVVSGGGDHSAFQGDLVFAGLVGEILVTAAAIVICGVARRSAGRSHSIHKHRNMGVYRGYGIGPIVGDGVQFLFPELGRVVVKVPAGTEEPIAGLRQIGVACAGDVGDLHAALVGDILDRPVGGARLVAGHIVQILIDYADPIIGGAFDGIGAAVPGKGEDIVGSGVSQQLPIQGHSRVLVIHRCAEGFAFKILISLHALEGDQVLVGAGGDQIPAGPVGGSLLHQAVDRSGAAVDPGEDGIECDILRYGVAGARGVERPGSVSRFRLHLGVGPAAEGPALGGHADGGRQGDRVKDQGALAALIGAGGHEVDSAGGFGRKDHADGAVCLCVNGDGVEVDHRGGGTRNDLIVGSIVALGGVSGDCGALHGNRAPGLVVGQGGNGAQGIVGVGLDPVVAVVRAVGPGTVGLLVEGGGAVIGVDPGAPVDDAAVVEGGVVGGVDAAVHHALGNDDGEAVSGVERYGSVQGDGVIAGKGKASGLGGSQRAGGGIALCGVLIDFHGVVQAFVEAAKGNGFQVFSALNGEDVGHLGVVDKALVVADAVVPALAVADKVAGAVVLIVVGIVVYGLGVIEEDVALRHGGVLVGDVAVTAVKHTGAPAVLADPGAGAGGSVGGERGRLDGVVPADHSDGVVGCFVAAAVLAGVVDVADVGVVVVVLVIADVAGAVGHDGVFDCLHVGAGNPLGVLDVADVVLVGIPAVQAGVVHRGRIAVMQGVFHLVCGAFPAHQGKGGHLAVAALIQAGIVGDGSVTGEHSLCVIGIGVVEEGVLGFREVQACGGRRVGSHGHFVRDHVTLNACHGRMSPAGAVGVLILDGGDPAVVPGVVAGGQRVLGSAGADVPFIGLPVTGQIGLGHSLPAGNIDGNIAVAASRGLWLLGGFLPGLRAQHCGGEEGEDHKDGQEDCKQFFHGFHS